MDSSATVNHDHLLQYMVNFNPIDKDIILSGDNLIKKTQKKDPFTSLHKIKTNLPLWAEFEILRNGAFPDRILCSWGLHEIPKFQGLCEIRGYTHSL